MTVRFSYINFADAAELTASSETTGLPATNLLDPRPTRVWRTSGAASENLVLDLLTAESVSLAALLEHNLTSDATLTLQANSSDAWEAPPLEESLAWHGGLIVKFFAAAEYRYWRLLIADAGNPDGFIQLGRIWLGGYFQPSRDFGKDFSLRRVDPSPVVYSDSGSKSVGERTPYRVVELNFPGTDEKAEFEQLIEVAGVGGDLIAALDPVNAVWSDGLHDYTLYCHLESAPEWSHRVNQRWSLRLRLRETI